MSRTHDGPEITVPLRWFNTRRGYGFATHPERSDRDVLLHVNALHKAGIPVPAEGARVTGIMQEDERGAKFAEVHAVEPPEREEPPITSLAGVDVATLPLCSARVKWFDGRKGFGFVQVFGVAGDVFLHVDVLRAGGLAEVEPGEALAIRETEGARGRMVAEVLPWEAALS